MDFIAFDIVRWMWAHSVPFAVAAIGIASVALSAHIQLSADEA